MPNSCYQSSYNKACLNNLGKARARGRVAALTFRASQSIEWMWVNPLYRRQPCLYIRIKLYDNI